MRTDINVIKFQIETRAPFPFFPVTHKVRKKSGEEIAKKARVRLVAIRNGSFLPRMCRSVGLLVNIGLLVRNLGQPVHVHFCDGKNLRRIKGNISTQSLGFLDRTKAFFSELKTYRNSFGVSGLYLQSFRLAKEVGAELSRSV